MSDRTAFRARPLLAGLLALAAFGAGPAAARAATLQVVPIGNGSVSVTPAATAADGESSPPCSVSGTSGNGTDLGGACTLTYPAGTAVTLQATGDAADDKGPATAFRRWSDDRCPAADACTVTVGSDAQSVAALFSPQRVSVLTAGTGSLTSAPTGLSPLSDCSTAPSGACVGDFDPDLSAPVTLTASTTTAEWLKGSASRAFLCDASDGPVCSVRPAWPRWASVGFGVTPDEPPGPPEIDVNFRVAKTGTGSGTVRSGSVDCGNRCAIRTTFGASETFTAVPDDGSSFGGWRAACGSAPTCKLAVGPVTSLTAVFEKGAGGTGTTNPTGSNPSPRQRAFAARVLALRARGHGRRRTISIRLRVNAAATVRARLLRGRRQVASHRWRVRTAGIHVLRMRVPTRARSGTYRVGLTVSGPTGTVRFTRSVRLRR